MTFAKYFLIGFVGLVAFSALAQESNDELAVCKWDVKQLHFARDQAESNVSGCAMQLDKAQRQIGAMQAKIEQLEKELEEWRSKEAK